MKLALTSAGIANKSIENELRNIIGKDFKGLKMLFCTTASNYKGGDMNEWLIEDLITLRNLGFIIDVCDINGINKENFMPRFEWADVFYFEGGNAQWLRESIKKSGLENYLKKLLETKIWIGASAGSIVLCPTVYNSCQELFDEYIKGFPENGLEFVDFQFIPHLNNEYFPKIRRENLLNSSKNLKKIDGKKVYVLDDNSAIFINNNDIKVVSEGEWFEI